MVQGYCCSSWLLRWDLKFQVPSFEARKLWKFHLKSSLLIFFFFSVLFLQGLYHLSWFVWYCLSYLEYPFSCWLSKQPKERTRGGLAGTTTKVSCSLGRKIYRKENNQGPLLGLWSFPSWSLLGWVGQHYLCLMPTFNVSPDVLKDIQPQVGGVIKQRFVFLLLCRRIEFTVCGWKWCEIVLVQLSVWILGAFTSLTVWLDLCSSSSLIFISCSFPHCPCKKKTKQNKEKTPPTSKREISLCMEFYSEQWGSKSKFFFLGSKL